MPTYPISNVTRKVTYTGSAGVGPYAFTFEILVNTDVAVYKNETLLNLTADYTVTINANGTGSVTLVSAAIGSDTITIVGNRAIQRTTDFVTGGDLFANTLNDELDSQTIFVQQVAETTDRALRAPVTDPTSVNMVLPSKAARANKVLSFDANGNPAATVISGTGTVTSVAMTVPAFMTVSGSPVTSVGTLALSLSGNALPVGSGGTGQTSYTDGQLLIGNSTGNTLTKATLTAGSGISITNGSGSITIAATGGGGSMVYPGAGIAVSTGSAWGTSLTAPSGTIVGTTDTQTLTNKRVTPRVSTITSSATPTINTDNVDMFGITALAVDITSFTTNLSGTPTNGQKLWIYIVGTATRNIAWGTSFESSTATLPTATVSTNRLDVGFVWNSVTSKWRCVAVA